MRESDIEAHLVARTRERGGECRKVKWIGRNGAPDRLVMLPGASIWVELKNTGERCSPAQIREHQAMRSMGQRVEVIDSFEGVDALLP